MSDVTEDLTYQLEVNCEHLRHGLRLFKLKLRSKKWNPDVAFGFDGRFLTVATADVSFLAGATGIWPGNAIVGISLVRALAAVPPTGPTIMVACDGSKLTVGTLSVGCRWQRVSSNVLRARLPGEWVETLALKYAMTRGRIIAEGLAGEIAAAEQELAAHVEQVAKSLAPLGVTVADLLEVVERRLQERHQA